MNRLLPLFLFTLSTHGLVPEALDPWRGWLAFKEFARAVQETPDPGVSVQFTNRTEERRTRLLFARQDVVDMGGWLTPTGAVVCEFTFRWRARSAAVWDRWSFDYGSFERFVDTVEQEPVFQDLIVTPPVRSAVYWEDA